MRAVRGVSARRKRFIGRWTFRTCSRAGRAGNRRSLWTGIWTGAGREETSLLQSSVRAASGAIGVVRAAHSGEWRSEIGFGCRGGAGGDVGGVPERDVRDARDTRGAARRDACRGRLSSLGFTHRLEESLSDESSVRGSLGGAAAPLRPLMRAQAVKVVSELVFRHKRDAATLDEVRGAEAYSCAGWRRRLTRRGPRCGSSTRLGGPCART